MMDEKPRFCLRNDDIKGFTGKGVKEFNVDDEVTLTFKCKVKGVSSDKHPDWSSNGPVAVSDGKAKKEPEEVLEKRVEFEVIGGGESGKPKEFFKRKPSARI